MPYWHTFEAFRNQEISVKSNSPTVYFQCSLKYDKSKKKYFGFSSLNFNLNHSNPSRTVEGRIGVLGNRETCQRTNGGTGNK